MLRLSVVLALVLSAPLGFAADLTSATQVGEQIGTCPSGGTEGTRRGVSMLQMQKEEVAKQAAIVLEEEAKQSAIVLTSSTHDQVANLPYVADVPAGDGPFPVLIAMVTLMAKMVTLTL